MRFPGDSAQPADHWLSRRSALGLSAVAASALAAGALAGRTVLGENVLPGNASAGNAAGGTLLDDGFSGKSLLRSHWNPYICDSNSRGWPWLMQRSVAKPSSAISAKGASTTPTTSPRPRGSTTA